MIARHDVVVIGGGIVGAAVAAHLSAHFSVQLLEMESQPGYHSTGRSAAAFFETYGNETVQALTRASRGFFYSPPRAFCAEVLVKPRPIVIMARSGQEAALEAFANSIRPGDSIEMKSARETLELHSLLKSDELIGGALIQGAADIDVHALHHGYLRLLQSRKGSIATRARVVGLDYSGGVWSVATTQGAVHARIVVNAAGAWAGEVGKLAGALDVGLQPFRRTACLIQPPPGEKTDRWPMLFDVEEQFYLKPEAGVLLLSPADESLTEPCDAQADDMDVAIAVDRIEQATTLNVKRVSHRWAGLRSFVKDRSPVVGYDPHAPGFFWLAALGGYGIQTAPALSRLAAALALRSTVDEDLLMHGIGVERMSPGRLM